MATNEQREEAARLYHEMLAAQQRYEDYGVSVVVPFPGEAAARCALTHQVLIESDEYLEDVETGDVVLRSAVGLAPRDQGED